MTNEELEHGSFEIENRIRNLMWTISGDYDLDTKPDVTSFYKSKYISIYDAIKQGAFSRFFDKDAFALYLLKKVYLGADESQLVTLGQICVEAACHDKIAKERPGVPDIRKKAFEAIMDHDFEKMLDTYTGKVKLAYMREALTGSAPADSRVIRPFEQLKRLEQAQKTEELVQAVDWFYNQMVAIAKMNSYIELNYGRSYLTPLEAERINHQICTGAHADCTLYFTDGILANMVKVNAQSEYARRTKEVNWRVYEQNRRMAKQNIDMLTNVLKRALVARNEKETYVGESGRILPNRLWNIGRTENRKLFLQESRRYNTDFVVEVLIDGSGSQRSRQSHVALQAFMISEALTNVGIPHRVMSFCTFWDYTVMRRFREYEDGREANLRIFEFYGSSNNRDGLAVRAAAAGLLKRDEENKILIVLSDGRPNDIVVNRPNSRNPRPYFGDYGTKDTAMEVRHLRNAGVSVLGVFTGEEGDLQAERRIFGKDFAYIRRIDNFSAVVGRYLKKQLEETCN